MEISINIVRHLLKKVEVAGHGNLLQSAPGYHELEHVPVGTMIGISSFLPILDYLDRHYPAAQLAFDVEYKYFNSGQLNMLGALGQLFQVASNLQEVTDAFYRFYSQFNKSFSLSVEERGVYVASRISVPSAELWTSRGFQLMVEMFVYGTIRMCRELFADPGLTPRSLMFPYQMPAAEKQLMEEVAGTKILHGDELVVVWSRELFVRPLPFANPGLGQHLKTYLEQQSEETEQSPVLLIKKLISQRLPGLLSLEEAAAAIFLSPRSLQRKLKAEGTSFQGLLEQVRKELALQELEKGKRSLKEIAACCGFKDTNSFFRAFRKWTGTTPGGWTAVR